MLEIIENVTLVSEFWLWQFFNLSYIILVHISSTSRDMCFLVPAHKTNLIYCDPEQAVTNDGVNLLHTAGH